jgi:hypothetical protein
MRYIVVYTRALEESSTTMPNVVLIGKAGVGKTVLMTVLAKSFERKHQGYTLIPMTHQTSHFVAMNWSRLTGGDWPDGTVVGDLRELKWELRIDGRPNCSLRFVELAGHDFTALFAGIHAENLDKQTFPLDSAQHALPGSLADLAQTICAADIIGLLVNLRDFVGEQDHAKRDENQWAIKFAMDWVRGNHTPRRLALVFTQAHEYKSLRRESANWRDVAARHLPYVYEAHLADNQVPIVAVTAVRTTKVVVEGDGQPRRVPNMQVEPNGTIPLLHWINRAASESNGQPQAVAIPTASPGNGHSDADTVPSTPHSVPSSKQHPGIGTTLSTRIMSVIGSVVVSVALLVTTQKGCNRSSDQEAAAAQARAAAARAALYPLDGNWTAKTVIDDRSVEVPVTIFEGTFSVFGHTFKDIKRLSSSRYSAVRVSPGTVYGTNEFDVEFYLDSNGTLHHDDAKIATWYRLLAEVTLSRR